MYSSRPPHPAHLAASVACLLLTGCGGTALVQTASSLLDIALNAPGLTGRAGINKQPTAIPLSIQAGELLNTSRDGRSLSLVVRVYSLRSMERLKTLTYEQLATPNGEKEGLGEDLISAHELILLPGKTYTMQLRSPPETTAIGITGLFRSPYAERWKLAFDPSRTTEIVIAAHACALTTSSATQIPEPGSGAAKSLVGVQCNK